MSKPRIQIPEAFDFLFQKARVKVAHGGRGGGKSESVGRYLLIEGLKEPMNIVCGREFQASIKDSVHSMLAHLVKEMGLESEYEVLNTEIRGRNGTQFSFVGLQRNINSIKSMHNVKKFWGEEAHTFSQHSLDVLFPTIRADDSELIFTLNPELYDDPSYQTLIASPPPDSIVRQVNYWDNPYFPEVLRREMEHMKETDHEKYLHIWEGQCKAAVEGAIFTTQLQKAAEDGRITDDVEYNGSVPVHTYWDLGKSDKTAIWFCQYVGMQWRVLRCYSNFLQDLEHYITVLQGLPYVYGTHYLPHDARQDRLGMQRSVEEQLQAALGSVEVVERTTHKVNSIEAAKSIFPLCWFHKTDCADGISALRRYRYALDPQTGKIGKTPLHDVYSDVADAFQCFAMAAQPDRIEDDRPYRPSASPRLG